MKITITERLYQDYDVKFDFPIYRRRAFSEDETTYWKFESHHRVAVIIQESESKISILHYDDPKTDLVKDFITSEDMLFGRGGFDIIPEKVYDAAQNRLIDLISRS